MTELTLLFEKIAQVAPQHYQTLVGATEAVLTSPFRDEITEDISGIMQKGAAFMKTAGFGREFGMGVASSVGAGIAESLAGDAMDAIKRGLTKTLHYRSMLRENPDLKMHPMGAHAVQGVFSTLHKFNPEFAGDPLVAGTFVRNHLESADPKRIDIGMLTNMTAARKNLSDVKSKSFSTPSGAWNTGKAKPKDKDAD